VTTCSNVAVNIEQVKMPQYNEKNVLPHWLATSYVCTQ